MNRLRVLGSATLIGLVLGLALPLLPLIVVVGAAAVVAVVLAVRSESRPPANVLLSATPWGLLAGVTVVFGLVRRLGLVIGLIVALVLGVGLVVVAGDIE